ncbi:hypothetical protein FN846DRAFT_946001 [Sphaerosporella brunnea]|uniref:polynucleotide adenylyltransferase n=1 Tax=Sphaerosporella brunnea TaxID=1250544 RepID=A0A5J5EYL6_9PEZI|nr:hypothetical protein FN846DRAFT_946001 [Sphaerosporella brunnea]
MAPAKNKKPRSNESLRKGGKSFDDLPSRMTNNNSNVNNNINNNGNNSNNSNDHLKAPPKAEANGKNRLTPPRDRHAQTGSNYVPPPRNVPAPRREFIPAPAVEESHSPSSGRLVFQTPAPRREFIPAPVVEESHSPSSGRPVFQTPSGRPYIAPSMNFSPVAASFTPSSSKSDTLAIQMLEQKWANETVSGQRQVQQAAGWNTTVTSFFPSNSRGPGNAFSFLNTGSQGQNEAGSPTSAGPEPQSAENSIPSTELGPKGDEYGASKWVPPHQRKKRKSEEIVDLPADLFEDVDEYSEPSKSFPDQHYPPQVSFSAGNRFPTQPPAPQVPVLAVFENGMRKTEGRGKMTTDYIGVVLPLTEDYRPTADAPATAPWLKPGKDYHLISDGMERLSTELADFIDYMGRKPMEITARNSFTLKIVSAIRGFFPLPGHDVKLYGSDAVSLALPTSDIDLMINAPSLHSSNPYMAKELKIRALYDLEQHFRDVGLCLESHVRDEAHIPILEMRCPTSTLEVDLSFEEPYSAPALQEVMEWNNHYGHRDLIRLLLPLKHALNMRKLGLAEATSPYQGGTGSYILLCMVIVFLETRLKELMRMWNALGQKGNVGKIFLHLLKFWGEEFDYETQAVSVTPPAIIPKSPFLPAFIFEVRSPYDGTTNIANGAFAIKHIKETLKHFYDALKEGVMHVRMTRQSRPAGAPPVHDLGILGSILGANYSNFERRRKLVSQYSLIDGPGPHRQQLTFYSDAEAFGQILDFEQAYMQISSFYSPQDARAYLQPQNDHQPTYMSTQAVLSPQDARVYLQMQDEDHQADRDVQAFSQQQEKEKQSCSERNAPLPPQDAKASVEEQQKSIDEAIARLPPHLRAMSGSLV